MSTNHENDAQQLDTEMTDDEKRRDQLLRAAGSTEADAAPRIAVSKNDDGVTRIDIVPDAVVRPGLAPESETEPDTAHGS